MILQTTVIDVYEKKVFFPGTWYMYRVVDCLALICARDQWLRMLDWMEIGFPNNRNVTYNTSRHRGLASHPCTSYHPMATTTTDLSLQLRDPSSDLILVVSQSLPKATTSNHEQ